MRTMVIVNHPYEGKLCHALADAAAQGAGGPGGRWTSSTSTPRASTR